jgi:hypothetical protein
MTDQVHYTVSFGFLGDLVNALIVHPKLDKLFRYRQQVVEEMFGQFP